MAKSIQFNSGAFSHTNSTDRFLPFGNSSNTLHSASEIYVSQIVRGEGFRVSNIQCYVKANTRTAGTGEIRLRKNNADGTCVCLIPFGTTGLFVSTGGDTYAVADTINYIVKWGVGGTGQIDFTSINCLINTATTNSITRLVSYINSSIGIGTQYNQIVYKTLRTQTTESTTQTKISVSGTLKNLYVYVSTNTRDGTHTINSRKNGADGNLTVSVGASTTGVFEDTSNTDTIADGDLLCWKTIRGGTTGSMAVTIIGADLVTTDDSFTSVLAGSSTFSPGSATDYFMQIGGNTIEADTDTQTKTKLYVENYSADRLRIELTTNTVASTSNLTFRKNGTDTAVTVPITASTTGLFEDTTHSVAISGLDDINYKLAAGGSGSLVVKYVSVRFYEVDPSAPPFLSGFSHRAPLNIDHTLVIEGIPYVPLYLSKCDATWWANVKTNGDDIRLTSDDGTGLLPHYLVPGGFDSTGKTGCVLVKTTSYISNLFDKKIYAYCGNAGASSVSDSSSVFTGSGYVGVYMPGVTLTELCLSGRDLTGVGSPGTAASGYEGITAATYNGTSQYHYYTGTQGATAWPMSLETLILTDVTTSTRVAAKLGVYSSTTNVFSIFKDVANIYGGVQGNGGSAGSVIASTMSTATWYYATVTRDSSNSPGTTYAYRNATQYNNTTDINAFGTADRFSIGSNFASSAHNAYWDGNVAVVLLSDSVRSADFIKTKYNAYTDASFITASATEVGTSPSTPLTYPPGQVMFFIV